MRTEYITLELDSALSNASLTRLVTTGCEILGGIFSPLVTWSFTPSAATASPKLCAGTPATQSLLNGTAGSRRNYSERNCLGDLRTQLALQYSVLVCGVDEVGRGALFGPVVAAAVILPPSAPELVTDKIRDSKQLSSYRRLELAEKIWALAVDCTIGFASTAEIDRINILQASLLAMKRAVLKLKVQPELCLVDGNQPIKNLPMLQQTLVKGDERSLVIASASIVAKVWRDALVVRLAAKYPMYDLVANKGYGTKRHLQALQQYGPSRLHRMSFHPCQIEGVGE